MHSVTLSMNGLAEPSFGWCSFAPIMVLGGTFKVSNQSSECTVIRVRVDQELQKTVGIQVMHLLCVN